jgi:hypothetical protein
MAAQEASVSTAEGETYKWNTSVELVSELSKKQKLPKEKMSEYKGKSLKEHSNFK